MSFIGKIVIGLIIVILLCAGPYIWALNSRPYLMARDFVQRSPEIFAELGHVKSLQLVPFSVGFNIGDTDGVASFSCIAVVDRRRGNLRIAAEKFGGVWSLKRASLDGLMILVPSPQAQQ